jgi:hypothetical protein
MQSAKYRLMKYRNYQSLLFARARTTFTHGLTGTFASVKALLVGAVAWSVPTFTITAPLVIVWRKSGIATTIAYIRYAAPLVVDVPAYRENEVRIYSLDMNMKAKSTLENSLEVLGPVRFDRD